MYVLRERYHVEIKVSRGRWSYIYEDRAKPIRDRSLGRTYDRESVLKRIKGFRDLPEAMPPEYADLPKVFLIHSELRLVTDLQNCVKAQQSWAYARKVMISNLQEMAQTVAWIQEQGIGTREELTMQYKTAIEQNTTVRQRCSELDAEIQNVITEIQLLGRYLSNKTIYRQFLMTEDKPAFWHDHPEQISEYEQAVRKLKEIYPENFPTMKTLKSQKAVLMKEHGEAMVRLKASEKGCQALQIAYNNVKAILNQSSRKLPRSLEHGEMPE